MMGNYHVWFGGQGNVILFGVRAVHSEMKSPQKLDSAAITDIGRFTIITPPPKE